MLIWRVFFSAPFDITNKIIKVSQAQVWNPLLLDPGFLPACTAFPGISCDVKSQSYMKCSDPRNSEGILFLGSFSVTLVK